MTTPRNPDGPSLPPAAPPRGRTTRPRVRVVDAAARIGVTIGGVGVIGAVLGILVYLVGEVVPLVRGGRAQRAQTHHVDLGASPLLGAVDEYKGLALVLLPDGAAATIDLASGRILDRRGVTYGDRAPTAWSRPTEGGAIALGFADGSVQLGSIGFETDFLLGEADAALHRDLAVGERAAVDDGYVERTTEGQLRRTRPRIELNDPAPVESGAGAVARIDYRTRAGEEFLVVMRADGSTVFSRVRRITPLGGGKPRVRLTSEPVAFAPGAGAARLPDWLFVTGDGSNVLALWADGRVERFAQGDASGAGFVLMEREALLAPGRRVTSARMHLGGLTLIIGDDAGGVQGVFPAQAGATRTPDGVEMMRAHAFEGAGGAGGAAVSAIGVSHRDRSFVVGDDAGAVVVRHMTSHKEIASLTVPDGARVVLALIAPKLDGVVAMDAGGGVTLWSLWPGHPEASARSLFGKVWYEGEAAPSFVYQSTAATDAAEPKMSLTPLVFGTIKATLYAMLFAVPIAVLAAIYTSEMLHPRVRTAIKPSIELMASLPSVVLGFVAAIVVAPLARDWLPGLLMAFVVVPYAALIAAHIWQLLPLRFTARVRTWQHLTLVGAVTIGGLAISFAAGGVVERTLFRPSPSDQLVLVGSVEVVPRDRLPSWARDLTRLTPQQQRRLEGQGLYVHGDDVVQPIGRVDDPAIAAKIAENGADRPDIRLWLDGVISSPWPGWLVVMTPAGLIIAVLLRGRLVDRRLRHWPLPRAGPGAAATELLKFLLTAVFGLAMAAGLATALSGLGLDARDSVFGPFTQRNTLVVAIVMGFAIIPIIYTISEDAMSSVPGALRSASLGCGATRWQTAVRVVLPLAMSGIFSACMIGLGRAVGETMIVLMATGNTPIMDWNIFSGFKTLSANIAVEMPEAPRGETHYRVLFLAGLCLFVLTFFVNTFAEVVRRRVRRRGAAL